MTEDELQREWWYRYEERLGMLCASATPTLEQKTIARNDANAAIKALRANPPASNANLATAPRLMSANRTNLFQPVYKTRPTQIS